jgi:hypothetical protein
LPYSRDNILRKERRDYSIYLDSILIEFENYYLDSDNIKSVTLHKDNNSIYIARDTLEEPLDFKRVQVGNSKVNEEKLGLIILNGVPIDLETITKLRISPNALKEVTILKSNQALGSFNCRTQRGATLIIRTK